MSVLDLNLDDISFQVSQYFETVFHLIFKSLAPNTRKAYVSVLASVQTFADSIQWPIEWCLGLSTSFILMYIGFMKQSGKAISSVRTHMAAISFVHKCFGIADPCQCFLVPKAIKGYLKDDRRFDSRQPISPQLVLAMCSRLHDICYDEYEVTLWTAVFQIAYACMLRVSEYTSKDMENTGHCIMSWEVSPSPFGLVIIISSSKSDQAGRGAVITLHRTGLETFCPVKAFNEYWEKRPKISGPVFVHCEPDSNQVWPVTPYQVNAMINKALQGFVPAGMKFSSHSFRIGSATYLKESRLYTDEQIMKFGRWRSANSYAGYCRSPLSIDLPPITM